MVTAVRVRIPQNHFFVWVTLSHLLVIISRNSGKILGIASRSRVTALKFLWWDFKNHRAPPNPPWTRLVFLYCPTIPFYYIIFLMQCIFSSSFSPLISCSSNMVPSAFSYKSYFFGANFILFFVIQHWKCLTIFWNVYDLLFFPKFDHDTGTYYFRVAELYHQCGKNRLEWLYRIASGDYQRDQKAYASDVTEYTRVTEMVE